MRKVVINKCFGGFNISDEAAIEIFKYENNIDEVFIYISDDEKMELVNNVKFENGRFVDIDNYYVYVSNIYLGESINRTDKQKIESLKFMLCLTQDVERDNKKLIELMNQWGSGRCSGRCANLKIIEIPKHIDYYIDDYDGVETIHEQHNSWD